MKERVIKKLSQNSCTYIISLWETIFMFSSGQEPKSTPNTNSHINQRIVVKQDIVTYLTYATLHNIFSIAFGSFWHEHFHRHISTLVCSSQILKFHCVQMNQKSS